jgi:hypothetical protein
MELEGQERVDKTVVGMRFKFHPNRGGCDEWKAVCWWEEWIIERMFREGEVVAGGKWAIKENWEPAANGQDSSEHHPERQVNLGSTLGLRGVSSGGTVDW